MGRKSQPPVPPSPWPSHGAGSAVTVGAMRDALSARHSARPAQGGCAGHGPRPQPAGQRPRRLQGSALTGDGTQLGPLRKTCTSPAFREPPARQGVSVPCSCQLITGPQAGGPQFWKRGTGTPVCQQGGLLPRPPFSACRWPSFSPCPHACLRVCVQASTSRKDSSRTGTRDHPHTPQ